MAKQTINVGVIANDRKGDPLRLAFQKTNSNFDEVYASVGALQTAVNNIDTSNVDRSWTATGGTVFDTVEWSSGSEITVTATAFETTNAVTYDSQTNSNFIYFVWDQNFIDTVWNSYDNSYGQNYSVSLDGGTTWTPVTTWGYNGSSHFYFYIPDEFQADYSFNYTTGQSAIIKYNRGSNHTVWFDLADAPISANNVIAVHMDLMVDATVDGQPQTNAKMIISDVVFTNAVYDDNTGSGGINDGVSEWLGSSFARNSIIMNIRKNAVPADAGRIYGSFSGGRTGTMRFYWNAKLYTITG